ncbi:Crp/Fnr family transcriptional regulator [Vulcanimicrobium alpinum]|nr:Crp/Fnr family transcriptional regulator [Vulcanimicrobium alpinum]
MVENTVWYLKRNRLFDRISDEVVTGCSGLFVQRTFPKRSVLFEQGDPARMVYLLKRGKVRISRTTPDGKEITMAILADGDLFGEEIVFGENLVRSTQATCLEESYLCMSRMQDLYGIMSRNPLIALNVAKYLLEQRDDALNAVGEIASLKVHERLLKLFERLAADHGVATDGGTKVDVRLTHAQIASLVGSTRETVTLELSNLVRTGRLVADGHFFVVPHAVGV